MYLYLYLKNLLNSEEGQDLIEYALIIALLVVAAVATLATVGGQIDTFFTAIGDWLAGVAVP